MSTALEMNDGTQLPAIGFGLYKVPPEQTAHVVGAGLDAGYTLIDGAAFYGNEPELGAALRDSGRREDVLVTSKFWGDPVQSYDQALADFERTETDLDIGPVDIYMIHWPRPARGQYVDVWRALIRLREEGRVRAIGVANFDQQELTLLIEETGVVPVINQVESHPWLPQHELRAFHQEHGIITQAWSPLGRGRLLQDPTLVAIAAKHEVTPAQVVLRWHLSLGGAAIPKSTHTERLRENLALDGFALDATDLAAIAGLENGTRTGSDPKDRQ
jgi:2,5-diketo-D-gluconate reductase A